MPTLKGITTTDIVQIFLRARLAEHIFSTESILRVDGFLSRTIRGGDFTVRIMWTAETESGQRFETVTVFYLGLPAWQMNFAGMYPEATVPFLGRALVKQYTSGEFIGGRGPHLFTEGGLVYLNHSQNRGAPDTKPGVRFSGRDEIYCLEKGCRLGWGDYWGVSLVD